MNNDLIASLKALIDEGIVRIDQGREWPLTIEEDLRGTRRSHRLPSARRATIAVRRKAAGQDVLRRRRSV